MVIKMILAWTNKQHIPVSLILHYVHQIALHYFKFQIIDWSPDDSPL